MPEVEPLPSYLLPTPKRLEEAAANQTKWAFSPPDARSSALHRAALTEGHLRTVLEMRLEADARITLRQQLAEALITQEKWTEALEFADNPSLRREIEADLQAHERADDEWCTHDRKFTHRTRGGTDAKGRSFLKCGVKGCGFQNTAFAPPELLAAEAQRAQARSLTSNQNPDEAAATLRIAGIMKENS